MNIMTIAQRTYSGTIGVFIENIQVALVRRRLAHIERPRKQALLTFQSAVRAGALSLADARSVWQQIEQLEKQRHELKSHGLKRPQVQQLVGGYSYLRDLITAVSRARRPIALCLSGSEIPLAQFRDFYNNIRRGAVTVEQLKLASFTRSLNLSDRRPSDKLLRMHNDIWTMKRSA